MKYRVRRSAAVSIVKKSKMHNFWAGWSLKFALLLSVLAPVGVVGVVSALDSSGWYNGTNFGPNHSRITDNVTMEYITSADTYTDIFATSLNVYLPPSQKGKTITLRIWGANVCEGNKDYTFDEIYNDSLKNTNIRLGNYSLKNTARSGAVTETTEANASCSGMTKSLSVKVLDGDYDPSLDMYVLTFYGSTANAYEGGNHFLNGFRLEVVGITDAVIGQASETDGTDAKKFGMQVGMPRDRETYGDFFMPFSTDCSVGASGDIRRISIYDADNNDGNAVQPTRFYIKVEGRLMPSGAWSQIEPTSLTKFDRSGSAYYPTSTSKQYSFFEFRALQNYEYRFRVYHLFNDNTLQFSLPFPAIVKARNCSPATLTGMRITDTPTDNTHADIRNLEVSVGGSSSTAQPFTFNTITVPPAGGKRLVTLDPPGGSTGWEIAGYSFCDLSKPDCIPANMQKGGSYYTEISNYYVNVFMAPGRQYEMRWVFTRTQPVACYYGSDLVAPATIDRGTPFTLTPAVNLRNPPGPNPRIALNVTGAGGYNQSRSGRATQVHGSDIYSAAFDLPATGRAYTTYTMRWTYTDGGLSRTCERTFETVKKPTFGVNNGDLYSGASVVAWNDDVVGRLFGSRGSHGVLAAGDVFGFPGAITAQLGPNPNGSELTFSNADYDSAAGMHPRKYGGQLASVPRFSPPTASATDWTGLSVIDLGSITTSGRYQVRTGVVISGGLPRSVKATLVSTGQVVIGGDITYAGGGYTSTSEISRLNVYADSIVVLGSVRVMKGLYVAESNFHSCGYRNNVTGQHVGYEYADYNTSSEIRGDCDDKLAVEGSVQAGELFLTRTAGEGYYVGTNANDEAETFTETQEFWMAESSGSGVEIKRYDYYVGLPPVL